METDCIEWEHGKNNNGYGYVYWYDSRDKKPCSMAAHRYAWIIANGRDIKPGLVIMHLCNNRICVNPEHLHEDTYKANAEQMVRDGRMYEPWKHGYSPGRPREDFPTCKRGHEWTEENTRWRQHKPPKAKWQRVCRACERMRKR